MEHSRERTDHRAQLQNSRKNFELLTRHRKNLQNHSRHEIRIWIWCGFGFDVREVTRCRCVIFPHWTLPHSKPYHVGLSMSAGYPRVFTSWSVRKLVRLPTRGSGTHSHEFSRIRVGIQQINFSEGAYFSSWSCFKLCFNHIYCQWNGLKTTIKLPKGSRTHKSPCAPVIYTKTW